MNQPTLNSEHKAALLGFLGLAVFIALFCAIELSTQHRQVSEYLTGVAFAATSGAMAGALFGYICRLGTAVVQHLSVASFNGARHVAHTEIEE